MTKEMVMKTKPKNLTAMVPKDLGQAMQLAETMAKSSLVPKEMVGKPADVLVAIGMGAEIGLTPFQAVQSIMVVNGRPTVWGDAALGLVRASGLLEKLVEESTDTKATCTIKRKMEPEAVYTFTMEDAKRAGLDGKQIWRQYPKRMLQMRARSFALRDKFTDVLKGLIIREEAEDYAKNAVETIAEEEIRMPESTDGAPAGADHGTIAPEAEPVRPAENAGAPDTSDESNGGSGAVGPTQGQLAKLMAMCREAGITEEKLDAVIKTTFGVTSKKDLTSAQLDKLYLGIEKKIREKKGK